MTPPGAGAAERLATGGAGARPEPAPAGIIALSVGLKPPLRGHVVDGRWLVLGSSMTTARSGAVQATRAGRTWSSRLAPSDRSGRMGTAAAPTRPTIPCGAGGPTPRVRWETALSSIASPWRSRRSRWAGRRWWASSGWVMGQGYHRCAVKADRSVWCWGANGVGQLGDGRTTEFQRAVEVLASGEAPPSPAHARLPPASGCLPLAPAQRDRPLLGLERGRTGRRRDDQPVAAVPQTGEPGYRLHRSTSWPCRAGRCMSAPCRALVSLSAGGPTTTVRAGTAPRPIIHKRAVAVRFPTYGTVGPWRAMRVAASRRTTAGWPTSGRGTWMASATSAAFGRNVVKFGMTQRQAPEDGVRELGDTSVTLPFDTQAISFTNALASTSSP